MGVQTFSLVDLDHCFRNAGKLDPSIPESAEFARVKQIIVEQSETFGYDLAEDGFPKKSNGRNAAQYLESLVAEVDEFADLVGRLQSKLKSDGVWLWSKGSIETHLGIEGKTTRSRSTFLTNLVSNGPEKTIRDLTGVRALVDWLNE
jgi:hypothetical protein